MPGRGRTWVISAIIYFLSLKHRLRPLGYCALLTSVTFCRSFTGTRSPRRRTSWITTSTSTTSTLLLTSSIQMMRRFDSDVSIVAKFKKEKTLWKTVLTWCVLPTVQLLSRTRWRLVLAQMVSYCDYNKPKKLCSTCKATFHYMFD